MTCRDSHIWDDWCWVHDSIWPRNEEHCRERMKQLAEEMRKQDREAAENIKSLIETMRGAA